MPAMEFTPAAGHSALTPIYDIALRVLTRERRWRSALLDQVEPRIGDAILDVGCGTGTLAIMIKQRAPRARVVGIDPDPAVLAIAVAKARRARVEIEWHRGLAQDLGALGRFDHVISALVFHQVSSEGKSEGLRAMFEALKPGGAVHVADYCRQPDWLMRQLFRIIQTVDGKPNTQANVDGAVEAILADLGNSPVCPQKIVRTPTGAISLFRMRRRAAR